MNLTHAMMWKEEDKVFRCRWGGCRHEVTWNQMNDASYHPRKDGVVFINEKDFNERSDGNE